MFLCSTGRLSHLTATTILAGFVSLATTAQLQYCRVDQSLRTDQCLAISTYHNSTSGYNDFYLLLSGKFEYRKGYAAFGTGSTMDGSLMFVLYPGVQDGDVTVSLRTTNYHYPPEPTMDMPDYQIIKTWVDGDYHNAQLVCYECDTWHRNHVDVTSTKQSWMFSNHYDYVMQTDDLKKPMSLHTDYDAFELDMTISHYVDDAPVVPELVENGRISIGAEKSNSWKQSQLFAIHGFLLAFAFIVLMPLGIAGIRSGLQTAYKIHWVVQLSSVVLAVSGMVWGIYLTWGHPINISTSNGAHKVLGFALLVLITLTPVVGYLHHLQYLKLGRATSVTIWHRRFGAFSLISAWVNVFLGVWIADQPPWCFVTGVGLIICAAFVIYFAKSCVVPFIKVNGTNGKYTLEEDKEGSGQGLLHTYDRV